MEREGIVGMERRGGGWEGKEDNETGRIAVPVHRRISCKVFCNFARTLSSN